MKKIINVIFVLIFSFLAVVSCGKKEDTKNEITFMIPEWGVPSDEMLKKFKDETGITVVVNTVSWDDIRNKISIASTGGSAAADVVEVDWSWVGEFYAADWLETIEMTKEDIEAQPAILPFIMEEKVLALPYANDFRIAYYNKDMFDTAGVMSEPKTWDEVYAAMKTIKTKAVAEYPFSMPLNADESTTTSLIWLAFSQSGIVFNNDGTLNKDAVLKALTFINNAVNVDKLINPANKTGSGMDAYRRLTAGEAAFIVGPTSFVSRVNDEKESKVVGKVIPILLPGATAPSTKTFALPEGVGVLKTSTNKEAAMKFVKWFNSKETQKELNYTQNTMPTRTIVLEELINSGKLKNSGALLEESKRIASPFPKGVPDYYAEMSYAIYNAVNEMANGKINPTQAFDAMNVKVSELAKK